MAVAISDNEQHICYTDSTGKVHFALTADEIDTPPPVYHCDFSAPIPDPDCTFEHIGIEEGAPGRIDRALRFNNLDRHGLKDDEDPRVVLPITINQNDLVCCTVAVTVFVEDYGEEGDLKFLIDTDIYHWVRAIALDDPRYNGLISYCYHSYAHADQNHGRWYTKHTPCEKNRWVHIVATWHRGNKSQMYVDGVPPRKSGLTENVRPGATMKELFVGGPRSRGWKGWVKDVKIWKEHFLDPKPVEDLTKKFQAEVSVVFGTKDLVFGDGVCSLSNDGAPLGTLSTGNEANMVYAEDPVQNLVSDDSISSDSKPVFRGRHSVSMSSDGEYIWAIEADGDLVFKRKIDSYWQKVSFEHKLSMVSVS